MLFTKRTIQTIMRKYKQDFEDMAHYDRTREKRWARSRIDITLNNRVIEKLRALKEKSGKPVSRIIEEAVTRL